MKYSNTGPVVLWDRASQTGEDNARYAAVTSSPLQREVGW